MLPCPCCGHLTLPRGPGDYEVCPVCRWQDVAGSLRYPLRDDVGGPNAISLVEAQRSYAKRGAVAPRHRRRVRQPRADEPLDDGWRPFDPALDWGFPLAEEDRWPVNLEALYYWRPTFWNGDQHALPPADTEPTNHDRFVDQLRRTVPELSGAIDASEQRRGSASAYEVCRAAARIAQDAFRTGDEPSALRIVNGLVPAVEEDSPTYVPNAVCINFLHDDGWHDPSMRDFVDSWPVEILEIFQEQEARMRESERMEQARGDAMRQLWTTSRGLPVDEVLQRLAEVPRRSWDVEHDRSELHRQMLARLLSNHRWLYRHPVDSVRVAWRFRSVQKPRRTLAWLRRPRFAG